MRTGFLPASSDRILLSGTQKVWHMQYPVPGLARSMATCCRCVGAFASVFGSHGMM